jgi:CHAT domain-containing protein
VFGDTSPQVADTLALLAVIRARLEDWPASIKARQEVRAIRLKLFGKDDWRTGDAERALELAASMWRLDASQRKRLWEADDSADVVVNLENAKRFADAVALAQQVIEVRRAILGRRHWQFAFAEHQLARLYLLSNEWGKASPLVADALAIQRATLGNNHPAIARSLNNLGYSQLKLGDYAASRTSLQEAIEIRRKLRLDGDPDTAQSLQNLGLAELNLHDDKAASTSFEAAVALRRRVLPKDHADLAWSLYELGVAQQNLRQYASARRNHVEALAIRHRGNPRDYDAILTSFNQLAMVEAQLGDLAAVRKALEEALAIRRQVLPKDHRDIANTLLILSQAKIGMGESAAARKDLQEALAILGRSSSKEDLAVATSLSALGTVQLNSGDAAAARKTFTEVVRIRRSVFPKDDLEIASSLYSLGTAQWTLHDFPSARASFEESLALRRKLLPNDSILVAGTVSCLGECQWQLHEPAAAEKSFQEALAVFRKVAPKDDPIIAACLSMRGLAQRDLKDFKSALKSEEEAVAIQRKASRPSDQNLGSYLNNLGWVQMALADYASARKSLREALSLFRKVEHETGQLVAITLENLAAIDILAGADVKADLPLLYEAAELCHRDQLRMALNQAEREQLAEAVVQHLSLSVLLNAAIAAKVEPGPVYDRAVQVKGGVTAQQRWAREVRNTDAPAIKRLLDRLRKVNRQILDSSFAASPIDATPVAQVARSRVEPLFAERADLERQLNASSPVYREFEAHGRTDSAQIRAVLPRETALVDIVEYTKIAPPGAGEQLPRLDPWLLAFVVRPDRAQISMVGLGPSKKLAELIDAWRGTYGAGQLPPPDRPDPAAQLRTQLWQPLAEHLDGVKVVLVSPDGPLHGLPWGALPDATPGSFLIEKYAFGVIPVPQLLPDLLCKPPQSAKDAPSLLLVGAIEFGDAPSAGASRAGNLPAVPVLRPLPGTQSEINDLRQQFEDAFPNAPAPKILRKEQATKSAFLTAAPSYRFVHLATHGFFADESEKSALSAESRIAVLRRGLAPQPEAAGRNPGLLSGVVFADVNRPDRPRGETILTALEAAELDASKTELLVLSACDTGRGQVAGGEGVLGLQRAFQLAGTRTVVASLWHVPDEETHQLMREFYRRVWSDNPVSKAEAMRQAQLWMLKNWKRGLDVAEPAGPPRPYYWAAFVLSGDWR